MDYQRRASRRRENGTARVEVKTTPDHNEKEKKQANDQRALFDLHEHDDPPTRPRLAIASPAPSLSHLAS
jgi:hypothetical protein